MAHGRGGPSAEEAAILLAAAREARRRSRQAAVGALLQGTLVVWGLDWMVGYTLVQCWPVWPTVALWAVASLGLYLLPRWRGGEARVVTGWEAQFRRAWWVILCGSAACTAIVAPAALAVSFLLLGAVWGIAYALYGVVASDREMATLGGLIMALAVAARLLGTAPLALFGLTAGGATTLLGLIRLRRAR